MKGIGAVTALLCAVAALAAASPAPAAEIVTRNASRIHLAVDNRGTAMVTYLHGGRMWHVFYSGAVNARAPSRNGEQVKFRVDYSGGRGQWRRFRNTCLRYDGPTLAWFVAGCKARDGSYWALQAWQRMLPNVGYVPWTHEQKVWELRISHWTREVAQVEAYTDWVYGGRFHEIFGRATYRGQAIHGYRTTPSGKPLDTFGRLVYLDTLGSAYGSGWKRENSFVVHKGSGMFCYGFYPHAAYGAYPRQRSRMLIGNGVRYRLTLAGPGVTPDVAWVGSGLPDYDPADVSLLDRENQMTEKVREMAARYGDGLCGHH